MLFKDFVKNILEYKIFDKEGDYCKFYMKVPTELFEKRYIQDFMKKNIDLYVCKYMDFDIETSKFPFEAIEGLCFYKVLNDFVLIQIVMIPEGRNIRRLWKSLRDYKDDVRIVEDETIFGKI